jgi:hypothetical protein
MGWERGGKGNERQQKGIAGGGERAFTSTVKRNGQRLKGKRNMRKDGTVGKGGVGVWIGIGEGKGKGKVRGR